MRRLTIVLVAVVLAQFVVVSASATYLTVTSLGEGTVSPGVGANNLLWHSRVTLSATPAPGWVFDRWEGDMAGQPNPHTFWLTSNRTARAIFRPITSSPSTALVEYVGKNDPTTEIVFIDSDIHFGWNGYEMYINSQTWRDASEVDSPLWQHDFTMVEPWFSGDDCLVLINGGSNPIKRPSADSNLALVCIALGVKYAQLDQVPNQPLYFTDEVDNRRTEDEILAYSLDKALLTGDWEWPVHCAMTKAAVKALDAVQEQFNQVDDFMVIGASKRGWTTWLTAAIDPRVKYMVPIVIDVLNFPQQVAHHWESYGTYSSAIQDYVDFDLFCRVNNDPLAPDLLEIVDPYSYIAKYTMPKLIINGSGDEFFLPDSSRYYYDDLPNQAQTHLRYYPNASHHMEPLLEDFEAMLGLLGWAVNTMNGTPNPQYTWTIDNGALVVQTSGNPDQVKLWQATNPTARDFRIETVGPIYTSSPLGDLGGGTYIGSCPPPAEGWTAFFVELKFGAQYYTTEILVTPDTEPFDGMGCF
ncbi:MAG: PhoPQ-activated pathogenicity [bacterium]|nr:PhoPQ-activated pathogenicity [bacterium]